MKFTAISTIATRATLLAFLCGGAAAAQCVGDCDGDKEVTVNELIIGVNIALGNARMDACPEFDDNRDGECTINELIAGVNNTLVGCPEIVGELTFDKISLAVFPGATETVRVTATDQAGGPDEWAVTSSDDRVVTVLKLGENLIEVSGHELGSAEITVTTNAGQRRSVPLRVYDPTVLDAGEILLKYVDTFTCRWDDAHSGANLDGSFYHPVVPEGWHALGSHGEQAWGCPDFNGKAWMLVVKADEKDADPITPPLMPPTDYIQEWNDAGTGGEVKYGAFWTPVCSNGYVAMGTVVTAGRAKPSLNDVTCVRRDLTIDAEAGSLIWNDKGTGGKVAYQGSFQLVAPNNANYQNTTAYLDTGTLVTRGQYHSCSGEGCWVPPPQGGHEVMHVLAVQLPTLIDTMPATVLPRLTSCEEPADFTEPIMAKAVLVPFTAILSGDTYASRGLPWMIDNSPFVRVEREETWKKQFWNINQTGLTQPYSVTWTRGVEKETSDKFSFTVGVSITAQGGAEFLGVGGKISATVSYQFGYETQHSVSEFDKEDKTVGLNTAPGMAAALWTKYSEIIVRLHNQQTGLLESVTSLPMNDSLSSVTDDYPNCGQAGSS